MFAFETKQNNNAVHTSQLLSQTNTMMTVVLEATMSFADVYARDKAAIDNILTESDGVFTDDIYNVLNQTSDALLKNALGHYSKLINNIKVLRDEIVKKNQEWTESNRMIIDKYRPLMKRFHTSKFTFTMPEYNFEFAKPDDAIIRVMNLINDSFGFGYSNDFRTIEGAVARYFKGYEKYSTSIKRAILGVPDSVEVDYSFYQFFKSQLVSNQNRTVSFTDEVFSLLQKNYINITDIESILSKLEGEFRAINALREKRAFGMSIAEYDIHVMVKAASVKLILLSVAVSIIEDIIKLRIQAQSSYFDTIRKAIVSTYQTAVAQKTTTQQETPTDNPNIGFLFTECATHPKDLLL